MSGARIISYILFSVSDLFMIDDNSKYNFALLGGDRRQAVVAERLIERGHSVKTFGLGSFAAAINGVEICSTPEKAISGSNFVLLPLPVSKDKINLSFASDQSITPISLTSIVELAVKYGAKAIIGGIIPHEIERIAEINGIEICDFYLDDKFQCLNALPSAEGALMLAMEHTEITLEGMKALVCGYGRIGSSLASLLKKLGATVTVAARSDAALCDASMSGYSLTRLDGYGYNLATAASNCDVVFNTVPAVIFGESILQKMTRYPLYIEIASTPGGIDLSAAREKQMRVIFAPSIPGKYAPISAGEYIYEIVSDILNKRGIIL